MASNVTLRYGSTGYAKVQGELTGLEKASGRMSNAFTKVGTTADRETPRVTGFFTKFSGSMKGAISIGGRFLMVAAKITAAITAIGVAAAGVAAVGFLKWGKSMLMVTEGFRQTEISMYGVLKSWDKVKVVSEFAKKYAAEFPAQYGQVMQTMSSLAMIPAIKPIVAGGDVRAMTDIMTILQSMATMRPDQGLPGAMMAFREALAGNWRSLQMRFDVPIRAVAESIGMTLDEMRASPEAAIKAMKAWTDATVGAETLAMAAMSLETQWGNVKEAYGLWLEMLGKAGVYKKVVGYIANLADFMNKLLETDKVKGWATELNAALEKVADAIAGVFTKGVSWEDIGSVGDLMDALKQVGRNALDAIAKAWDANKDILLKGLQSVMIYVAKGLGEFIGQVFIPVGVAIGKGILTGVSQYLEQHPLLKAALEPPGMRAMAGVVGKVGEATGLLTSEEDIRGLYRGKGGPSRVGRERYELVPPIEKKTQLLGMEKLELGKRATTVAQPPIFQPLIGPMQEYKMWSGMAGALAKAPRGERVSPTTAFATGQIGYGEYAKQQRVEDFQREQMTRLTGIAEAPGVAPGVRAGAYQEMFGIAVGRGETGKAGTYMEEALKSLTEQAEKKKERDEKEAEDREKQYEQMKLQNKTLTASLEVQKGILAKPTGGAGGGGGGGGGGETTSYVEKEEE